MTRPAEWSDGVPAPPVRAVFIEPGTRRVHLAFDAAFTAIGVQILAHAARLRRAGETRIPLHVMCAGYDEALVT